MKQNKYSTIKLSTVEPNALSLPETADLYRLDLTESDWRGYAAKLAEAMREKTKSMKLSVHERERFGMNCELIRRVGIGNEIRNYVILEVHQTKQWRADFKTISDFAKAYGLSRSQLYKCINEAAIKIQMAEAGLYSVRPQGRHVERLAKIEPKHRVEAWSVALKQADEVGGSAKVIDDALDAYTRRLKDPNAGIILIDSKPAEKLAKVHNDDVVGSGNRSVHGCAGWIESLDSEGENVFAQLLTLSTWYKTKGEPNQSRGRCMAYALVETALEVRQSGTEIKRAKEAVRLAIENDHRLKRAFYHLSLQLILNHLNELYAKEHQL